jgi:hypothetical protein
VRPDLVPDFSACVFTQFLRGITEAYGYEPYYGAISYTVRFTAGAVAYISNYKRSDFNLHALLKTFLIDF